MSVFGGYASPGDSWWPRLVRALLAVAGAALLPSSVGCADEADVADVPAEGRAEPVEFEDHWHAAVGVYVCDEFLPATPEFESPDGIHTHGDGVIHIHPFTAQGAGDNATLSLYLDGAGIEVSDDELSIDGQAYTEGADACGGEQGEVVVVRWADVRAGDAQAETVDPDVRFRSDGEGYVVAYVASGADVPKPESAALLDDLAAPRPAGTSASTGPPTSDDGLRGDEAPVETDQRSLADGFYLVEGVEPAPCRTPDMRPDPAGESCYVLPAEPALGTDIIEEAEVSEAPSLPADPGWQIALTLSDEGINAFNDVAATCFQRAPTCPYGQLALVVDGEVVTAPTIAEESYERDEISVSGSLTEDEARSIADELR